jgi:N-acetyl-anhydromuramyl-L-alanine amidase AmpD
MKQEIIHKALSPRVLAVAVLNRTDDGSLFDWSIYIDSIPGKKHINEAQGVAQEGNKVCNPDLIRALYPEYPLEAYRY